eukprot:COSAG06_NODE_1723_length_8586_cov_69.274420_3_plen_334_part_00
MRRVCWISLPRDHVEAAVGYGRDASLVVVRVGGPVVHQREVVGPAIGVHRDEVRHGGQAREVGDRGTGALAVGVRRQRLDAGRRPHPIPASPRRPQKINRSRRAWVLEEEEEDGDDDGGQRERCPSFFAVRQTPTDAPVTPATKVAAVGADGVGLVRVVQLPVQTAADHAGDEHHGMARGLGQRIEATARVESARALPKAAGVVAALGACAPLPAVTRARPHLVEQEQEQRPHGGWGAAHRHEPRSRGVLRCCSRSDLIYLYIHDIYSSSCTDCRSDLIYIDIAPAVYELILRDARSWPMEARWVAERERRAGCNFAERLIDSHFREERRNML